MATVTMVLNTERSQIGVTESPRRSNRQKYGAAFGANGVAWCGWFQQWCFYQNGVDFRKWCDNPGYTPNLYGDLKALGWAVSPRNAQPGDLIFFNFPGGHNRIEHVGCVEQNRWPTLVTIEGNTSGRGSQTNGGAVMRKQRVNSFAGAIRVPLQPEAHADAVNQLAKLREAINYAKLGFSNIGAPGEDTNRPGRVEAIKLAQSGLNRWMDQFNAMVGAANPPDLMLTGWFDQPTRNAVIALQRLTNTNELGVIGPKTWALLYP